MNSIDLIFDANDRKGKKVVERRRLCAQHRNRNARDMSQAGLAAWGNENGDLFLHPLEALASAVGFHAEQEPLTGAYTPVGHYETEKAQKRVLNSAALVLSGEQALKMELTAVPRSPETVARQEEIQARLLTASSDGDVNVEITYEPDPRCRVKPDKQAIVSRRHARARRGHPRGSTAPVSGANAERHFS
ncbi:MAG: hypothetical protein N2444_10550, partial [Methylocystis sp.]|nr:hypothetical protein [Methylocystis sp.]